MPQAKKCVEMAQLSNRHFWHLDYNKAVVANLVRMTKTSPGCRLAPPILGTDKAAVLSQRLGLDEAELGALRQSAII